MKIILKIGDRMYRHGKFLHILTRQNDMDWYAEILVGNAIYRLDLIWHHECDDAEMSGWNLIGHS